MNYEFSSTNKYRSFHSLFTVLLSDSFTLPPQFSDDDGQCLRVGSLLAQSHTDGQCLHVQTRVQQPTDLMQGLECLASLNQTLAGATLVTHPAR